MNEGLGELRVSKTLFYVIGNFVPTVLSEIQIVEMLYKSLDRSLNLATITIENHAKSA